jgi:uncharacterized protein YecT (DUF1311 family)
MPTDRSRDPWAGSTYKGFSGGGAGAPPPDAPPGAVAPRRSSRRVMLIAGVGAALLLGLGLGFLARPELVGGDAGDSGAVQTAPSPAGNAEVAELPIPGAARVPIAIHPAPPAPVPQAPGKLETLPPEMASASQAPGRPAEAAAAESAAHEAEDEDEDKPTVEVEAPPQPQPQPPAQFAAAAPPIAAPAPAPRLRASFDCATAHPGAEQLICSDPELAAADREMYRAYRRALRADVDPYLPQEQRDWIGIREDAARHSRRAVVQVYDQRIQELNHLAEGYGGPPDGGDYDGE